jgi:DNA-binding CsgD family transcriptional regulator
MRVEGVDPSYGKAYESVRDQDRSRRVLLTTRPGTFWCVRRDAPPEDFDTELYRVFDAHDLHDLALFRLPNVAFGNLTGCFFRHKGVSSFDADDLLLFEMLFPLFTAAMGTRRALALVGADGGRPVELRQVRACVHVRFPRGDVVWSRRARTFFEERLGPIGTRGIKRIERALHAAIRRLDRLGTYAASQSLIGGVRLDLANVPPTQGETRRVLVVFVDETPTEEEAAEGALTPAEELLSPRERSVARLAASGLAAPEIAMRLVVGEATVRHHLRSVFRRLRVRSRAELVRLVGSS